MLAAVRALGHLLALVGGAAAGVLGCFTFAYTDASLPVGLLVALCLCLAVFVTAGLALRSRGAAAFAAAGWLVTVGFLSMERPEGDLVVPATTLGYAWLLVGTLVAGLSLALPYRALSATHDRTRAPVDALAEESSGRTPTGR
jgi:Family of unknown function (DUF6113)